MSWAAARKTTRAEDRAYSLMGLFGINMPMLYGEGERAFLRLQEEIIKRSTDQTIFAWTGVPECGSGLLAGSLECFRDAGSITQDKNEQSAFALTNRGLQICLFMTPWTIETYVAMLSCANQEGSIAIFLRKLMGGLYERIRQLGSLEADGCDRITNADSVFSSDSKRIIKSHPICVQQHSSTSSTPRIHQDDSAPSIYGIKILSSSTLEPENLTVSNGEWNPLTGVAQLKPGQFGTVATIDLRSLNARIAVIKVGLNFDFQPRCVVAGRDHESIIEGYKTEGQVPIGAKSVWDVTCTEDWLWSTEENSSSSVITPLSLISPIYNPKTHEFDQGCDLWGIELIVPQKHSFTLMKTRRVAESVAATITISPSSSGSQFVWAISVDL